MATNLFFTYLGTSILPLKKGYIFDFPMFAAADFKTSAFSVIVKFPIGKIEIQSVLFSNNEPISWFCPPSTPGQLRIGWFASDTKDINFAKNSEVLKIQCKVLEDFTLNEQYKPEVTEDIENEVGYNVYDEAGHVIDIAVIPNMTFLTYIFENGSLLVSQRKELQGYESTPIIEKCSNCLSYILETRKCDIGNFVVGKSAKCMFYTRNV